jgi:hypothetical protein
MRVILAAVIGGAIVFGAYYVSWKVLPYHKEAVSALPDEKATLDALGQQVKGPGAFVFPTPPANADDTEQEKQYEDRLNTGPVGLLLLGQPGEQPMSTVQLLRSAAICVGSALLAAILLAMASLRHYLARVFFVLVIGLFAAAAVYLPQWNWLYAPTHYTLVNCAELAGVWLAAGIVMAMIVRPKRLSVDV